MSNETVFLGFAIFFLIAFFIAACKAVYLHDELDIERRKHWLTNRHLEDTRKALREERERKGEGANV